MLSSENKGNKRAILQKMHFCHQILKNYRPSNSKQSYFTTSKTINSHPTILGGDP